VSAEAAGKVEEARECYQAALAIEEARARLRADTLQPAGTGRAPARVLGLTLALRLKLASLVADSRPTDALAFYLANAANEARIDDWELGRRLSAAMLPDPEADTRQTPSPPMAIALMMQSRVLAGKALIAARRPREAVEQFAAAVDFPTMLRQGGDDRPRRLARTSPAWDERGVLLPRRSNAGPLGADESPRPRLQ
jgi:hypothetical protein